ncbi:hypothetical protein LX87_03826 [Larkinella arboricola]|uniref:Uncharacterized protein n=1 Tax=Larkinella arboricola TaxID=643671 RepID=A0A327WWL4_LARAB|nr:hypothetical protein LX87_03826 [Larkinella arboricola]
MYIQAVTIAVPIPNMTLKLTSGITDFTFFSIVNQLVDRHLPLIFFIKSQDVDDRTYNQTVTYPQKPSTGLPQI